MTLLVLLTMVIATAAGLYYHFAPPQESAFMRADPGPIIYQHVSLDHISRYMIAETIGHEDQSFPTRWNGVNYGDYAQRAWDYITGTDDNIGSTIPEQLAKNLWLNQSRTPVRMAAEVALTEGMTLEMPKKQQLELYLNFAQFGPHLYGICAASWYYFNEPPSYMSIDDAARLTGVLPGPAYVKRGQNGGFMFDNSRVGQRIAGYVQYAHDHAMTWWTQVGGLRAAQRIGILDLASDHKADTGPDSCAHRPAMVAQLLQAGGYVVPPEPVIR